MATSTCKSCGASIIWLETPQGKKMPVDAKPEKRVIINARTGLAHVLDAYMPHWSTCPNADQHRAPSGSQRTSAPSPSPTPSTSSGFVTERQLRAIMFIARKLGWSSDTLRQRSIDAFGVAPNELNRADASSFIGELQRLITQEAVMS